MAEHNISVICEKEGLSAEETVRAAALATLEFENVEQNCDICIVITDNENIKKLNAEHRNIDRETDVLSFPMLTLEPGQKIEVSPLEIDPKTGAVMLGDLVISLDKVIEQAKEYGLIDAVISNH